MPDIVNDLTWNTPPSVSDGRSIPGLPNLGEGYVAELFQVAASYFPMDAGRHVEIVLYAIRLDLDAVALERRIRDCV